jgi:hypothetical protein
VTAYAQGSPDTVVGHPSASEALRSCPPLRLPGHRRPSNQA